MVSEHIRRRRGEPGCRCRGRHEIGATVTPGESFAYNAGGGAKVGEAAGAAEEGL